MRATDSQAALRRRPTAAGDAEATGTARLPERDDEDDSFVESSCCSRAARATQNGCYQFMAATIWDYTMSGFRPGRVRAMELLTLEAADRILLVGEGSGLDFDCLPEGFDRAHVYAFDFSPEMVRQAKLKAHHLGIPEENIFEGDAQRLPYTTERFNKIYFPLSLGSIPDPRLALQEAERVLAPGGKIVIFEKMVDEGAAISLGRSCLNFFTRYVFADINRRLTHMMGADSPLKLIGYESLSGRLEGCLASTIAPSYRLATLARTADFPDAPSMHATLG